MCGETKYFNKTTDEYTATNQMDFIVKFQTSACQRLHRLESDWTLFIHKSWKESVHTQHVEVFFPKQVHMVALLATAAWHAQNSEAGGSGSPCSTEMIF